MAATRERIGVDRTNPCRPMTDKRAPIQLYGGSRDGDVVHVDLSVLATGVYVGIAGRLPTSPDDTTARTDCSQVYRWDGTANPHGHARYRLEAP